MDEEEPTLEGSEAQTPRAPSYKQNWSTLLETRKKSLLSDDDRLSEYLEEQSNKEICSQVAGGKRGPLECNCLSCLRGDASESSRTAVGQFILWFAKLPKATQQLLVMEKIRAADSVHRKKKMFLIPFKDPDDIVAAQEMGQTMICVSAFLTVLRIGKTWYSTCRKHVNSGTIPTHQSTGRPSPLSRAFRYILNQI
jgi:hypothetical protein